MKSCPDHYRPFHRLSWWVCLVPAFNIGYSTLPTALNLPRLDTCMQTWRKQSVDSLVSKRHKTPQGLFTSCVRLWPSETSRSPIVDRPWLPASWHDQRQTNVTIDDFPSFPKSVPLIPCFAFALFLRTCITEGISIKDIDAAHRLIFEDAHVILAFPGLVLIAYLCTLFATHLAIFAF